MMTITPPALDARPQFTAEYWRKVPRQMFKGQIARIQQHPDTNQIEIFIKDGPNFRHNKDDVAQLLTPNLTVHAEVVNNEMVVGLFVPDVKGWAWRMTDQQIADYARELAIKLHAHEQKVRSEVLTRISEALETHMVDLELRIGDESRPLVARALAATALGVVEQIL